MRRTLPLALVIASLAAPADAWARPDDPLSGDLYKYDAGDVVLTHATPRFVIHYALAGSHAVDVTDADATGVPDDVEIVGATYEAALDAYEAMGFLAPLSDGGLTKNGGDAKFDVYLLDFAGVADGTFVKDPNGCTGDTCIGYMVQENDFVGYAYASFTEGTRVVSSHEFFHAIQAAYDVGQGPVMDEGSAVWATEQFDGTLDDFEGFIGAFLSNVDRPLDEPLPGPADGFRYGAAIFFRYLSEKFGPDTVRELWEACADGAGGVADPYWLTSIDGVVAGHGSSFPDAFTEFATWNLFTAGRSDPTRSYVNCDAYPSVPLTTNTFPWVDDGLRLYRASAQYFRINADGRTEATLAMLPETGMDLAGLRAKVFVGGPAPDFLVGPDIDWDVTTPLPITFGADDRIYVILINTAVEGESKKPVICAGTAEEILPCDDGMGGGGAGGAGGAGGSGGQGAGPIEEPGGCQCQTSGGANPSGSLALLLGLLLRRRRRS